MIKLRRPAFLFALALSAGVMVVSPSPAFAQAVSARLKAQLADYPDYGLSHFYGSRSYEPLWLRAGKPTDEARQVVGILAEASKAGIAVDEDEFARLTTLLAKAGVGQPVADARAELAVSEAWVHFVQSLPALGDQGVAYIDGALAPYQPFPAVILKQVAEAPSLKDHLAATARINPFHAGLLKRLIDWRGDHPDERAVPTGATLVRGDSGERVRVLRGRLELPDGDQYDERTAAAVRFYRKSHGLAAGTTADRAMLERLNRDASDVERRLLLNLDRARSLPIAEAGKYIVVDAANARLWLMEGGEVRDTMKVVVGKESEPTPLAAGLIRTMVLNPYWNVPPDLVRERIAQRVLSDGVRYLRDRRYEVLSDWSDDAKVLDPKSVNWRAVAAGEKALRVRQKPGAANAMGDMKFLFPNRFGVYLHDTPRRELFEQAGRDFSSGCVRLEDAPRVAAFLFGAKPPKGSGRAEEAVPLPRPVPVYLTYLTARWDQPSSPLADDTYGRDRIGLKRQRIVSPL